MFSTSHSMSFTIGIGVLAMFLRVQTSLAAENERASRPQGANTAIKSLWEIKTPHEFQQAMRNGIGFSFVYDGKQVGPELPNDWQTETEGAQASFRHASGLLVIRQARTFPQVGAVEYTVRFRNDGKTDLPALSAISTMDLTFERDASAGDSITWCGGGGAEAKFPPRDFAVTTTPLAGLKEGLTLAAEGGKPSRTHLPFFFVQNQAQTAGLFVGIGWTGQWRATVRLDPTSKSLIVQAGIPDLEIRLRPGEEISGPTILLGSYCGSLANGTNALRRLIRDHYAPKVGDQRLLAPALYTTWFDVGAELDEKLARVLIDRAAEMGQEVFLFDAGWYKGTVSKPYTDMRATWDAISSPLGNWEEGEELSRFPSGMKALADQVRAKGMQYGLWFEPERCGPQSLLAQQHPDWVMFIEKRKWGQVDFGNPAVQEHFCRIFDRYINGWGVRYIRWDMNQHDLLSYWATKDAPGRRGITQIRYVEGLHKVEDHIRSKHPDVILESCTGGGNRIDLTTLQRRHTIWVSDQKTDPQITRFHLEGLNQFIPGNGLGVAVALLPNVVRQPGFVLPDVTCQTCFGGAFGLRGRLQEWPQTTREAIRRHVDVFKQLRPYLSEDYYLLTPQGRTLDAWSALQFHDPQKQAGFVQTFRLRSREGRRSFVLQGLDAKARYEFSDPYSGNRIEAAGADLLSRGLEFDLPEMTSRVLTYKAKP